MPTRELALQTASVCKELGKYLNVQVMTTTGGTSLRDDILRLGNAVHLVVATPGRLLDLTEKGVADLSACRIVAMDEVCYHTCELSDSLHATALCALLYSAPCIVYAAAQLV